MEDDFFIGRSLKKTDFFYYEEKKEKVVPFIITNYFQVLNKTEILMNYNKLFSNKNYLHPHSYDGWWLSIYATDKYIFEKYKINLINANYSHNAFPENIIELKEIYNEIKDFKYLNETLLSKERHILTLNQPHFWNLYQLNIKHKKINIIPYRYIPVETLKKYKLNMPLFVINTGGNYIPTYRHYKIQNYIMNNYFNFPTKYELVTKNQFQFFSCIIRLSKFTFITFINSIFLKLFLILTKIYPQKLFN